MGNSVTLAKKEFLELSLEIDDDLRFEISTGFTSGNGPAVVVNIPVTVEEVGETIANLQKIYEQLKTAKKCPRCGQIRPTMRYEESELLRLTKLVPIDPLDDCCPNCE